MPVICARRAHATKYGWWGPPHGLRHCRRCRREWAMGSRQIHCVTCCAHFSRPGGCDLHLTGTACRPPVECRTKTGEARLVLGQDKYGAIWRVVGRRPLPWSKEAA